MSRMRCTKTRVFTLRHNAERDEQTYIHTYRQTDRQTDTSGPKITFERASLRRYTGSTRTTLVVGSIKYGPFLAPNTRSLCAIFLPSQHPIQKKPKNLSNSSTNFLIALTSVAVLKEIIAGNLISEVPQTTDTSIRAQTKDSKYLLPSHFPVVYLLFFAVAERRIFGVSL